ncbi:MAG TPA: peptidylprolyl isomerase [Spirochaetales bacterium]|nr:peptidylprolyl isomerase [Spirochaetales bacterium]HPG85773.1 peptidylprolyl isomerase [Spirochaetales bacterium]
MMKDIRRALMGAVLLCCSVGPLVAQTALPGRPDPVASLPDGLYAVIETVRGTVVLELYADKAPFAVASFVGLAEGSFSQDGRPYYDGVSFHRVEPGFVVQGGDPTGTGRGGPGYQFPNEITPELGFNAPGVLGMANAGPDTNGSQFFITLGAANHLNGGYTVFGRVVVGMDAVRSIRKGDAMTRVTVARKGAKARAFKADKARFDADLRAYASGAAERAKAGVEGQFAAVKARIPGLALGADGLWYKALAAGNGAKPATGSMVRILYTLTLADGRRLDSTADRGNEPLEFRLGGGQVIPGFDKAVSAMSYGERRVVVIPPELGYGSRGAGGVVPPDAVLVFEIELLKP